MALGLPSILPGEQPSVHDLMQQLRMAARPSFSFEFFPPKDDLGEQRLWSAVRELEPLQPTFVSVTYGAGGSTQERTVRMTKRLARETTLTPVGHLTCVGSSVQQLRQVIGQYADAGVRNVLALRGDPPSGAPWSRHPQGLNYASELVELLQASGNFCVGVAAFPDIHPESPDSEFDAQILVAKAAAGAKFAITQMFFDPASYIDLVSRVTAGGANLPIIPGLMPITSVQQITRVAALVGAEVPAWVVSRLHRAGTNPAAMRAEGIAMATELAQSLLDAGAPGIHFYTLNTSSATLEIYRNLVGASAI